MFSVHARHSRSYKFPPISWPFLFTQSSYSLTLPWTQWCLHCSSGFLIGSCLLYLMPHFKTTEGWRAFNAHACHPFICSLLLSLMPGCTPSSFWATLPSTSAGIGIGPVWMPVRVLSVDIWGADLTLRSQLLAPGTHSSESIAGNQIRSEPSKEKAWWQTLIITMPIILAKEQKCVQREKHPMHSYNHCSKAAAGTYTQETLLFRCWLCFFGGT